MERLMNYNGYVKFIVCKHFLIVETEWCNVKKLIIKGLYFQTDGRMI
jgi:hypothetical protein